MRQSLSEQLKRYPKEAIISTVTRTYMINSSAFVMDVHHAYIQLILDEQRDLVDKCGRIDLSAGNAKDWDTWIRMQNKIESMGRKVDKLLAEYKTDFNSGL